LWAEAELIGQQMMTSWHVAFVIIRESMIPANLFCLEALSKRRCRSRLPDAMECYRQGPHWSHRRKRFCSYREAVKSWRMDCRFSDRSGGFKIVAAAKKSSSSDLGFVGSAKEFVQLALAKITREKEIPLSRCWCLRDFA